LAHELPDKAVPNHFRPAKNGGFLLRMSKWRDKEDKFGGMDVDEAEEEPTIVCHRYLRSTSRYAVIIKFIGANILSMQPFNA